MKYTVHYAAILFVLFFNFALSQLSHADCQKTAVTFLEKFDLDRAQVYPQIGTDSDGFIEAVALQKYGNWIEKRSLQNEVIEIHHVTNKIRKIYSFDPLHNCKMGFHSEFQKSFSATAPNDLIIESLLRKNKEGLIYAWSPKMPLSASGRAIISKISNKLHIPVTYLIDPVAQKHGQLSAQVFDLQYRGLNLHYPALFYYSNGKIKGLPILGNRGVAGYQNIINKLREPTKLTANINASRFDFATRPERSFLKANQITVTLTNAVQLPDVFGYFDKPIWGTRWMGVHVDWQSSSFFHLDTKQLVNLGYTNDTYVTPHDSLYTTYWSTPGNTSGSPLGFMETSEFLKIATLPTYIPKALFIDPTINADYQSVGTLVNGSVKSTYRVLTGGYSNILTYRDYEVTHRVSRIAPMVKPLARTYFACKKNFGEKHMGVPILSKDGRELAFTVAPSTAGTLIYKIDPTDPENCIPSLTLPYPTSKIAFSFDAKKIAFVMNEKAYIYDRETNQLIELTGFIQALGEGAIKFPEFNEDGTMVAPFLTSDRRMFILEFKI